MSYYVKANETGMRIYIFLFSFENVSIAKRRLFAWREMQRFRAESIVSLSPASHLYSNQNLQKCVNASYEIVVDSITVQTH